MNVAWSFIATVCESRVSGKNEGSLVIYRQGMIKSTARRVATVDTNGEYLYLIALPCGL